MVRGTNTMWLLMAPDGQVFARGLRTAAGVLKGKLHTLAVGKQVDLSFDMSGLRVWFFCYWVLHKFLFADGLLRVQMLVTFYVKV
nr:PREDICTED: uncharacterized protein LOC103544348 isoform X3 [Equus przewalskii]